MNIYNKFDYPIIYPPYMDESSLDDIFNELDSNTEYYHFLEYMSNHSDYFVSAVHISTHLFNRAIQPIRINLAKEKMVLYSDDMNSTTIPSFLITKHESLARELTYLEYLEYTEEQIKEWLKVFSTAAIIGSDHRNIIVQTILNTYSFPTGHSNIESINSGVQILNDYEFKTDRLYACECRIYNNHNEHKAPEFSLLEPYRYWLQK